MPRKDIEILPADGAEQIALKLTEALNHARLHLGPVMVFYRGEPYAAVVPPDAALAWARAVESERLNRIATRAAGLPEDAAELPEQGELIIFRPGRQPGP